MSQHECPHSEATMLLDLFAGGAHPDHMKDGFLSWECLAEHWLLPVLDAPGVSEHRASTGPRSGTPPVGTSGGT